MKITITKIGSFFLSLVMLLSISAFATPTSAFAYDTENDSKVHTVEVNVISEAMVTVGLDNSKTLSVTGYSEEANMGDGTQTCNAYLVSNATADANNTTPPKYVFLTFDLSKISGDKVYEAILNYNIKFNSLVRSGIYVYAADGLSFDNSQDFVAKYPTWDAVEAGIDRENVRYKQRTYGAYDKSGAWIKTDLSTFIRHRARCGYPTATIMIDMHPEVDGNSHVKMAIAAASTENAPYIDVKVRSIEDLSDSVSAQVLNIKSDYTSGKNTEVISEPVENMTNGNTLNSNKLTDVVNNEIHRVFYRFDIEDYKYDNLLSCSLKFLPKFASKNSGRINFYAADNLQCNNLSEILVKYDDQAEFDKAVEKRMVAGIASSSRLYTPGEYVALDVTAYVKDALTQKRSSITIMGEYVSEDSGEVCYIAGENTDYSPLLDIYVDDDFVHSEEYDSDSGILEASVKLYRGTKSGPINATAYLEVYDKYGALKKSISNNFVLDGSGNIVSLNVLDKTYTDSDVIKFYVKDANGGIIYQAGETAYFDDVEGVFPSNIYTVTIDSENSEREYNLSTYVDYLHNEDSGILFNTASGLSDHFEYPAISAEEQGDRAITYKNVVLPLYSDKYLINKKQVTQINISEKKKANGPIRLLCIGDSITRGLGTDAAYWQIAQELFWKESVDFNEPERKIMTLGTGNRGTNPLRNRTLTYNGVTETLSSYSDGIGGWMVSNFLYHPNQCLGTAEEYALAGGTDTYTGSAAQKDFIQSNPISSDSVDPFNMFFDNEKEGKVKFSISKWLERYRTHDDNGNRLEVGNGTGTLVTEENQYNYTVCTPTHVLLQFGTNDMRYYSIDQFRENMWTMVNELKKQIPGVTVIISMTPPQLGSFNSELYDDCVMGKPDVKWWDNARYWNDYFENYDQQAHKTYLLPTYFVTQTWDAFDKNTASPAIHPSDVAHASWGYQLYALLKYIGCN